MKFVIKNIINEEDKNFLPSGVVKLKHYREKDNNNAVLNRILNAIQDFFPYELGDESYCKLESTKSGGHSWHTDTGSNNHMPWCKLGGSILLKKSESGGLLKYRHGEIVEVIEDRKLFDLYLHTSDVEHMITHITGERIVFLLFI